MGTQNRYRYVLFATLLLLALLLLLQACTRDKEPATETPRAGGTVVAENEQAAAPTAQQAAPTPVPAEPTPTPVIFTVGQTLTATAPVTLFATAASSSNVLDVYDSGTPFTVLEPNQAFTAYPVEAGGAAWVRLRAADGLAGWAKADSVTP